MDQDFKYYGKKKRETDEFLWSAIEKYVTNSRERAVKGAVQVGNPLTHEQFLRRTRRTYG